MPTLFKYASANTYPNSYEDNTILSILVQQRILIYTFSKLIFVRKDPDEQLLNKLQNLPEICNH